MLFCFFGLTSYLTSIAGPLNKLFYPQNNIWSAKTRFNFSFGKTEIQRRSNFKNFLRAVFTEMRLALLIHLIYMR